MIDAISQAVAQTPGCVLLDVDAGPSTNRTVYTFVGPPEDVVQGALNAARTAFRLIDMSKHKGEGGYLSHRAWPGAWGIVLGGPLQPLRGLRRSPWNLLGQVEVPGDSGQ